jgi:uncharacterized damage-inducible protein DinB
VNREKWFNRTFDFALPASRFPDLIERLRGTPARLEERTRSLSRDVITQRQDERWSVQENVGHLLDLEPLWLRRAEQLFAGEKQLVPADLSNRATHEGGHNGRDASDLLRDFRAARSKLVVRLSGADEEMITRSALHPRLQQPMRLIDLALFVAEHDDHHLVTITELLSSSGNA